MELACDGTGLAGVLDGIRDGEPERFDAINEDLGRWLPEFDRILFETPQTGVRSILLRTRTGGHKIRASDLSGGTLVALALLTLSHLAKPPTILCLEEPDRGIHPRLLRDLKDALYRLSYPQDFGENRQAVQVIATTHSPYMLDLFSDHPEEIVIAQKTGLEATFQRLSDQADIKEILRDAHLGELWYSGLLGGVPSNT
jgi:predicted ATPase